MTGKFHHREEANLNLLKKSTRLNLKSLGIIRKNIDKSQTMVMIITMMIKTLRLLPIPARPRLAFGRAKLDARSSSPLPVVLPLRSTHPLPATLPASWPTPTLQHPPPINICNSPPRKFRSGKWRRSSTTCTRWIAPTAPSPPSLLAFLSTTMNKKTFVVTEELLPESPPRLRRGWLQDRASGNIIPIGVSPASWVGEAASWATIPLCPRRQNLCTARSFLWDDSSRRNCQVGQWMYDLIYSLSCIFVWKDQM